METEYMGTAGLRVGGAERMSVERAFPPGEVIGHVLYLEVTYNYDQ